MQVIIIRLDLWVLTYTFNVQVLSQTLLAQWQQIFIKLTFHLILTNTRNKTKIEFEIQIE